MTDCKFCETPLLGPPSKRGLFCGRDCYTNWRHQRVRPVNGMKPCNRCKAEKPLSEYYEVKTKKGKPYLMPRCKGCVLVAAQDWNTRNPERRAASMRQWGIDNRERRLRVRRQRLYGLTPIEELALTASAGGVCAICNLFFGDALSMDHNHINGAVRGMLCRSCNSGLGHFEDDPARMVSAIRYLGARKDGIFNTTD